MYPFLLGSIYFILTNRDKTKYLLHHTIMTSQLSTCKFVILPISATRLSLLLRKKVHIQINDLPQRMKNFVEAVLQALKPNLVLFKLWSYLTV